MASPAAPNMFAKGIIAIQGERPAMKPSTLAMGLLALALAAAGCASSPSYSSPTAPAASATSGAPGSASGTMITMQNLAFAPASLQATTGQTVTWVNHDQVQHTVTADDGSFDSGPIAPGASYTHTFQSAGTVAYHCTIHPQMKGTLAIVAVGGMASSQPAMPGMQTTPPAPTGSPPNPYGP